MKLKKIVLFGLTLVFAGTATALAACETDSGSKQPPEYTIEDGRPNGELAAPDEGFAIDGVLDEAAYEDIRWLEGPVLRPYYTSDGQGVYYDYDVIRAQTEKAAQVKMGTYYGEKGVYIAYSFKEQAGKVCYVNPSRRAYRNSGVELHIGIPSSLTMTGDETISRLTVNANGALSIAKTQGDIWMAPYGTEDPANMPYVGLTGNGTRTDENADRTEFTFELFLPWGYFDEVGGEGTAQSMKEGGDLVVAPGVITANNYTGSGQTDREYYVISARLDDGAWSDPQGWYHFNADGYEGYGITVKAAQNGTVQEWMGYDTAPKNSSVVFVTKADEGYALKEFRVNGAAVPNDHIHYDMYTTLGARAESSAQKAYIRIPEDEIAGDISVEAVFEPLDAGEQTLVATIYGESRENVLANTKVTFTRGDTVIEGVTDGNGVLTLSGLTSGLYDVAVDNLTYRGFDDFVFFSAEKQKEIVFEKNALSLEGSENISSNYLEIYGKIGSVADGFVFSGFFGFEGADYDELVNFTNTVYFITDKASGEQFGFRFTKWGNYLMLKCEGAEYHFEGDAQAVEYFKQEKGVHFMFAVDSEGNISVYMRRSDTEWINLSTSGSVRFPVEKEIMAVNFAKQDDGSAKHVATLRDGSITVGTSRVDLPVDITLNGGAEVTGGRVEIPSDIVLGDRVTVTLTPERYYGVQALKVNGAIVDCVGENGVYTYTFTAEKQSYAIEASFERIAGDYSVVLTIAPSLTGAADDLRVVLVGGSVQYEAVRGAGSVWTAEGLAYGRYSVVVSSRSGGYTVVRGNAVFSAENGSTTLSVTADNYGDDRTYALEGESDTEGGIVIAEGLGATAQGFVYEGFLGVGGAGDLNNIGDKNYAAGLRFTTASGDQFRLCFYIWNGKYWLIKAFREGQENTAASHEFAFTDNTALIDYVKRENGITLSVAAAPDGTLTVYAMTSSSEWLLIGEWQSPFAVTSPIEKVEVLRMFQSGIEGWTAKAEGELRFGTSDADIPVTITGAGSLTGGTVGVSRADIGDTVTLTITPAEGYALSGLQLDGSDVEWTDNKDGTYSYTFTAVKSRYALTVAFGVLSDLAIEVDVSAVPDAADDLVLRLENKAGEEIALTQSGAAWTAEDIPYGAYVAIVGSKSGGYTVLREEIAFSAENESVTVSVTADNYGDNRVYTLEGETDQESGVVIAKDLGATEEGFVFTGFLGVGGAGDLNNIGDKNYAAGLRFTTASGDQFRLCFYIWNGKYWLIKAFREGQENTAASHEFAFTDNTALIDYVKQENGITVTIVAEPDGTLTVYAKTSDAEWTSIGEWQSPFAVTSPIEKVEVLRMFQNGLEGWTAKVDGELRFGTTDAGIPAVNVLTETIDLDENGEVYWEHYSSGNGAENDPTVTDVKAGAEDRIVFDPSEWDRYETRPYGADNAQAFVGTSQNGALNSKGFVFRDSSKELTATVTIKKGDKNLKVYTGTWIPDCGFTIALSDADGNSVGAIGFTVNNSSATYETVFTIDTSGWSEEESRTFTLTCGSTNTLKLMAIAIS